MKIKTPHFLFALYFVASLACNSIIGLPDEAGPNVPPLTASGNGPQGLTAEATSADSVLLTWQPVEGAASYHIQVSANGDSAMTVIDLASSVTSYEDFMAPPDSQLTYAVEVIGDAGSIGQSTVNVNTPARVPNPLQMYVEFDYDSSVHQVIGPVGGTLSVVDDKGVLYELSIPANALAAEMDISLIPLGYYEGWPLDGELLGLVGIGPEGLVLAQPATLTITPPGAGVSDELLTIGVLLRDFGRELSLSPVDNPFIEASTQFHGAVHFARPSERQHKMIIVQPVRELRPTGAGKASRERTGEIVKNNPPSDPADAARQKETASTPDDDDIAPLYSPWIQSFNNVRNKVKQSKDCRSFTDAVYDLEQAIEKADAGNAPQSERGAPEEAAWDDVIKKTKEILDKAAEECKKKSGEGRKVTSTPCASGFINNISNGNSSFYQEYRRRMAEKYGEGSVKNAKDKLDKECTPGYSMSGGADGMHVNEIVCTDLAHPFSVKGVVEAGGLITLNFRPDPWREGELPPGGWYNYSGAASRWSLSGDGRFRMSGDLKVMVRIEGFGPGSVSEHAGQGSESYALGYLEHACTKK